MAGRGGRSRGGGAGGNDFFLTFGSNAQEFADDLEAGVLRGEAAIKQLGGVLQAYERIRIQDPTKGTPFKNPFREMEASADKIATKFERVFQNLTDHVSELRADIRDALGQIETLNTGQRRIKGGKTLPPAPAAGSGNRTNIGNVDGLDAAISKIKGLPLGRVNTSLDTFHKRLETTATRTDTARSRLVDFNKAMGELNATLGRMKAPESIDLSGVRFTVDGAQIGGNFVAGSGGITGIPAAEHAAAGAGTAGQTAVQARDAETAAIQRAEAKQQRLLAAQRQEVALRKELHALENRPTTQGDKRGGQWRSGGKMRAEEIQRQLESLEQVKREATQFSDGGDQVVHNAKDRLRAINEKYKPRTSLDRADEERIAQAMRSGTSPARDNSLATADGSASKGDPAKSQKARAAQAELDRLRAERIKSNQDLEASTAAELKKNHRQYMTQLREHKRGRAADPADFAADPKGYAIAVSRYNKGASQKELERLTAEREQILARNAQTERSLNRKYQERRRELELELGALQGAAGVHSGKGRVKLQGARRSIVSDADLPGLEASEGRQQERFAQRRADMSAVIRELVSTRPDISIHELGVGGQTAQDILHGFDQGLQSELRGKTDLNPDERRRLLAAQRRDLERADVRERSLRGNTGKGAYRDAFAGNDLDTHRYVGEGLLGDIPQMLRSLKERRAANTPDARGYHVVGKEVESAQKRLISLQSDLGNAQGKVYRAADTGLRREAEQLQRLLGLQERLKTATSMRIPAISKEMVPVLNEDGTAKMRRGKPVMKLPSLLDAQGKPLQSREVVGSELERMRANVDLEVESLRARVADGVSLKELKGKRNAATAAGDAGEAERLQKRIQDLQDRALAQVRESFKARAETLFRQFRRLDVSMTRGMTGAFGGADIQAAARDFEGQPQTAQARGRASVLRAGVETLEGLEDSTRTGAYDRKLRGIDRGIQKHETNIARALRAGQAELAAFYKDKLAEAQAFRAVVKKQRDAEEHERTFLPQNITEGGTHHARLAAIHSAAQVAGIAPTGTRDVTLDDHETNRARQADIEKHERRKRFAQLEIGNQKRLQQVHDALMAGQLTKDEAHMRAREIVAARAKKIGMGRQELAGYKPLRFEMTENLQSSVDFAKSYAAEKHKPLSERENQMVAELADLRKGGSKAIKRVVDESTAEIKRIKGQLAVSKSIPTYSVSAAELRKHLRELEESEAARRAAFLAKVTPPAPVVDTSGPKPAVSLSGRQVENEIADLQKQKVSDASRAALIRKQLAGADAGDKVLISELNGIEKGFKEIDRKIKTLNKKLKDINKKEAEGTAGGLIGDAGQYELEGKVYRRSDAGKWQRHTKAGFRNLLPTETTRMEALNELERTSPAALGTTQELGENALMEQIRRKKLQHGTAQEMAENNHLKQLRRRNLGTDQEFAQDELRRRAKKPAEARVNDTARPARQPRSDADRIEAGILARSQSILRATTKQVQYTTELLTLKQQGVTEGKAVNSLNNKIKFHAGEALRLEQEIVRLQAGDVSVLKSKKKADEAAAGAAAAGGGAGKGKTRAKSGGGGADDTGGSQGVQRSGTVVRVHLVAVDASAARAIRAAFNSGSGGGGVPRVSRTAAEQAMEQLNDTARRRATASARRISAGERTLAAADPEFIKMARDARRLAGDSNGNGAKAADMATLAGLVETLNKGGVRRGDARSAVGAVGNVTQVDLAAAERLARVTNDYGKAQGTATKAKRTAGQAAREAVTPLADLRRNYEGLSKSVHEATRAELEHIKAQMQARVIDGRTGAAQAYAALARDPNLKAAKVNDVQRAGVLDLEMRPLMRMNRSHLQQSAEAGKAMGAEMAIGIEQGIGRGDKLFDRIFRTGANVAMRDFAGMFVYGITNQIGQTIQAGLETESTYIRVSAALEATGKASDGMRASLAKISSDTGAPLLEVYQSAAQLVGVFDNTRDVTTVTRLVYELQAVSAGALNAQESFRALTAITSAYGLKGPAQLRRVADMATNLQLAIGVNVEDTLEGTARLAPIAKQYGMDPEEIATLTGVVGKATGQTGTAASEQVGRILETLNSPRVRTMLTTFKGKDGEPIAQAEQFQEGEFGDIISQLMNATAAGSLDDQQKTLLASALGGQRNFASASAILNQAETYLRGLTAAQEDNNKTAELSSKINAQLQRDIARLSQNFTNLGAALISAGVLQGLEAFIEVLNGVLSPIVQISGAIGELVTAMERLTGLSFLSDIGKWAVGLGVVAVAIRGLRAAFGGAALTGGLQSAAGLAAASAGLPPGAVGGVAAQNAARMAGARNAVGQTARALGNFAVAPVTTTVRGASSLTGNMFTGAGNVLNRMAMADLSGTQANPTSARTLAATDRMQNGMARAGTAMTKFGTNVSSFASTVGRSMGGLTGALNALNIAAVAGMIGFMVIKSGLDQIKESKAALDAALGIDRDGSDDENKTKANLSVAEKELAKANDPSFMRVQGQFWGRGLPGRFSHGWDVISSAVQGKEGPGKYKGPGFYETTELDDKTLNTIFAPTDTLFKETIPGLTGTGVELDKKKLSAAQAALDAIDEAGKKAVLDLGDDIDAGQEAAISANIARVKGIVEALAGGLEEGIVGMGDLFVFTTAELQGLNQMQGLAKLAPATLARNRDAITELATRTQTGQDPLLNKYLQDSMATEKQAMGPFATGAEIPMVPVSQASRDKNAWMAAGREIANLRYGLSQLAPGTQEYMDQMNALNAAIAEEGQLYELIASNAVAAADGALNGLNKGAVSRGAALSAMDNSIAQLEAHIADTPEGLRDTKEYFALVNSAATERQKKAQTVNQPATNASVIKAAGTRSGTGRAQATLDQANLAVQVLKDSNTLYEAGTKNFTSEAAQAMAAVSQAQIGLADSINAAANAAASVALAGLTDPVAIAAGNLAETRRQLAQGGLSPEARSGLQASEASQRNAVYDATQAQKNAEAMAAIESIQDPVARAQAQLNETLRQEAANRGRNATQAAQLLAQERQQRIAVAQAMAAERDARSAYELAVADAKGAGGAPSARIRVGIADRHVGEAKATGNQTAILTAEAEAVTARAGLRDATLQDTIDTIEFQKEMNQITGADAIAQYQQILKQKDLTRAQRRDIMRKIKGYQTASEGQWNIGEIKMPTIYEVRRAIGSGAAAAGGAAGGQPPGSYQAITDARTVHVTINGGDMNQVKRVLDTHLGANATTRVSTSARKT